MSSPALELQDAVIAALKADAGVAALVAGRISDGNEPGAVFPNITLGASETIPEDMDCITARSEFLQVDCWVRDGGKRWPARQLADAVKAALHDASLSLVTHALAKLLVERVIVMGDPDGITAHGIVHLEALIEEH